VISLWQPPLCVHIHYYCYYHFRTSLHRWAKTCTIWLFDLGLFHSMWQSPIPTIFLQMNFILFYNWVMLHCAYMPQNFFIHSAVGGHLDWFYSLTIVNSAVLSMGMQVYLFYAGFYSFEYMPRIGIATLYGSSIFRISRHFHIYSPTNST
jgi:hypothetical protein